MLLLLAACLLGSPAPAAPAKSKVAAGCANVPVLRPFKDARGPFAPGGQALRTTAARFSEAYRRACASGEMRAAPGGTLHLSNAPEANTASIYREAEGAGRMVLEYPFVDSRGRTRVPTVAELRTAILCSTNGAGGEGSEPDVDCLVD